MTTPHSLKTSRFLTMLLLAFALVASATSQGLVVLHEHANLGGQGASLPLAAWPKNGPLPLSGWNFDDKATSLHWNLLPNTTVTFYEHSDGSGAQWHIGRNDPRVGINNNIGPTYNDTWSAWSWQIDDPSIAGTVTLYENSSYGGISKRLPLSSYSENLLHALAGYGDMATSIVWDLQPNVIVTFYEHSNGTGREWTLTHQQASGSISAVHPNYNDKFSSFRWHTVDPSQGWMRLFTDSGFSGYQLTRYVSLVGFGETSLSSIGMNDQVDSFTWGVPIGTTIMLYDHNPKGGASYSLTGNGVRDVSNSTIFHDKISVIDVLDGDFSAELADRNKPYDENCYLSSHNAHVAPAHGWLVWNQDLVVHDQLDYGARALQLDTQLNNGTIHLVHGSWTATLAQRLPGTTPQTLQSMLQYIKIWMDAHPREILTLIFENHDGAELGDYLLDVSPIKNEIHVQKRGSWLTPNELIAMGKRYVVFETASSPASGRIPWQYDFSVENDFTSWNNTSERFNSLPIDSKGRGVFYMNNINPQPPSTWLPGTTPNDFVSLVNLMSAFPQFPNFVGIDRIREGGQGGADAVRYANTSLRALYQNRATFASFAPLNCGTRWLSASNRPTLGSSLNLTVDQLLVGNPAFEFMIYGSSDESIGALPLPMLLPPSFGSGCTLRVANNLIFSVGFGGYPITVPVAIPLSMSLNGYDAFFQSLGLDSVTGDFVMSNGARAHLGLN